MKNSMNKTELEECEVTGNTLQKKENPVLIDTTKTKVVGIYGLQNKLHPSKWYVGQSYDVSERWTCYKNLNCKNQIKLYRALIKYGFNNFDTTLLEVCEPDQSLLNCREDYWMNFYDSVKCGYNLKSAGSNGKHSEESKVKMSLAKLGKKRSPMKAETKFKIGIGNKGKILSDAAKKNISLGIKNSNKIRPPITEKTREKMRLSMTGKLRGPHSQEHKRKISLSKTGITFSDSHKQNMSIAAKKRWESRHISS